MQPVALLFLFVLIGIPVILTVSNIALLFAENRFKTPIIHVIDIAIFALGILYTMLLTSYSCFYEWSEQIYPSETYTPISFEALPTFLCICAIAVLAYLVLRFLDERLPPIIASLCYGGIFLGVCFTIVLTVQLWCDIRNPETALYLLFPYNYILCSVRLIRKTAAKYAQRIANTSYDHKLLQLCKAFLGRSVSFTIVSFLTAIPLLIAAIVILLLFGQQPDSVIKMFTETAEWTLSQKIPPPRLDYQGHYLCTVAACGDEKVVKPLRAGKRNHELIIVNRQLLVANAFEDLIAERTPRLHKLIRKTYDRLGLPISKYITTKRRSNIVYYVMKPLEWLFLLALYTFDTKPEDRIHRQYLG